MKKHLAPSILGSFISYLFFLLMSVFFAFFYQQTFFYMLVVLQLCLPVISYYLSKRCFHNLQPVLMLHPNATQKGCTANVIVQIKNPTKLPFSSVAVTLSFFSFFYRKEDQKTHVLSLRAHSDNQLEFPVTLTKCGLYEASVLQIEGFDYLHLFHFQKSCDLKAQIRIFPTFRADEIKHEAIYTEGFDEFEESEKKGNVSSNVTDIREYLPGDRLQKIHWKLSSKIDKLMVKENEATSTNEFLLLLELYQPSKDTCALDTSLSDVLDRALEEAHSLALELIEAQEIFVFSYYSTTREDFVMSTIRCEEDLTNAFSECFYEPAYETENLALDIYEKSGLHKGTLLHVTHKGVDDVTA